MLNTAGGLVVSGGTNDRMVLAFDATNGNVLRESPTSSGVEAPITRDLVDGKQRLARPTGLYAPTPSPMVEGR
jgi:alcohol dehydrogenase (cytochrome c)